MQTWKVILIEALVLVAGCAYAVMLCAHFMPAPVSSEPEPQTSRHRLGHGDKLYLLRNVARSTNYITAPPITNTCYYYPTNRSAEQTNDELFGTFLTDDQVSAMWDQAWPSCYNRAPAEMPWEEIDARIDARISNALFRAGPTREWPGMVDPPDGGWYLSLQPLHQPQRQWHITANPVEWHRPYVETQIVERTPE